MLRLLLLCVARRLAPASSSRQALRARSAWRQRAARGANARQPAWRWATCVQSAAPRWQPIRSSVRTRICSACCPTSRTCAPNAPSSSRRARRAWAVPTRRNRSRAKTPSARRSGTARRISPRSTSSSGAWQHSCRSASTPSATCASATPTRPSRSIWTSEQQRRPRLLFDGRVS